MKKIGSLLVYCGSNEGIRPSYKQAAFQLGQLFARHKIDLVYGGGNVGLMRTIADSVLEAGGQVTGIIPNFLLEKEVAHNGVTHMHVVSSMHERKALMERLCDGVIALPGGFGTMDELFEILTWAQLGLHFKPIGLLNVNNFYNHFIAHLDKMVEEGFLKPSNRSLLIVSSSPEDLLNQMIEYQPKMEAKWMKRGEE